MAAINENLFTIRDICQAFLACDNEKGIGILEFLQKNKAPSEKELRKPENASLQQSEISSRDRSIDNALYQLVINFGLVRQENLKKLQSLQNYLDCLGIHRSLEQIIIENNFAKQEDIAPLMARCLNKHASKQMRQQPRRIREFEDKSPLLPKMENAVSRSRQTPIAVISHEKKKTTTSTRKIAQDRRDITRSRRNFYVVPAIVVVVVVSVLVLWKSSEETSQLSVPVTSVSTTPVVPEEGKYPRLQEKRQKMEQRLRERRLVPFTTEKDGVAYTLWLSPEQKYIREREAQIIACKQERQEKLAHMIAADKKRYWAEKSREEGKNFKDKYHPQEEWVSHHGRWVRKNKYKFFWQRQEQYCNPD